MEFISEDLVIFLVFGCLGYVYLAFHRHLIAGQVLVISRDLIDQVAVHQLHDAVRGRLNDLMVTGGEQHNAGKLDHTVVQSGDTLHIQMVRRLIEDQHIRAGDHHLGKHAADALTSGEYIDLLHAVITGEEHTAKETADIGDILSLIHI